MRPLCPGAKRACIPRETSTVGILIGSLRNISLPPDRLLDLAFPILHACCEILPQTPRKKNPPPPHVPTSSKGEEKKSSQLPASGGGTGGSAGCRARRCLELSVPVQVG